MDPLFSSTGASTNGLSDCSVRIVVLDHYLSRIHPQFLFEQPFINANTPIQVPIIRVFGSTPDGIHTCLHIHNVFPYIYIPNIFIGTIFSSASNFPSPFSANVSIVDIVQLSADLSIQLRSILTELAYSIDEAITLSIEKENPKFPGNLKQSAKKVSSHVFSIVPVTARFVITSNTWLLTKL